MLKRLLLGFLFGALATVPMTAEFLVARKRGLIDEVPPHKAIRSVTTGLHDPALTVVSGLSHVAVGGAAGAVYTAVLPRRMRGAVSGTLFGIGVWLAGYEAVMPAATDIRPAHRDRRDRAKTIFIAHLIYGATLGLLSKL
jgi:hypothetical protein